MPRESISQSMPQSTLQLILQLTPQSIPQSIPQSMPQSIPQSMLRSMPGKPLGTWLSVTSDKDLQQLIRTTWFEGFKNSKDVALRFVVYFPLIIRELFSQ